MKKILLLLLLLPCLTACEDESDASPVAVYSDFLGKTVLYSNSICEIKIEANSNVGALQKLTVSSFDPERGYVSILDSTISGKSMKCTYYYTVPQLKNDSTVVKLTISAKNTEGDERSLVYSYLNVQRDYPLEETSGITLYSIETDAHPNGFCLSDLRPLMVSLADSAKIDIYTYVDPEDQTVLSREWRTNTDIYFARVNTFDYAGATQKSVTETFAASIGNPRINGLKNDDIILVGRGNQAVGAIKIIQVFDEEGSENDRYLINIKKIR